MLLVYLLILAIVLLLGFSLSRETGKNTKYARKNTNAIVNRTETASHIRVNKIGEAN